jgi:hypothetical protein
MPDLQKLYAVSWCSGPAMRTFLHYLSVTATFVTVFSLLYLVQDWTLGLLPGLRSLVIGGWLPVKSLLFSAGPLFIIWRYVEFYSPYRDR